MYSFEQSEQLKLFLLSLGAGFILGIIYDVFRTVRLTISKNKALIFVFDILYFITFALATFIFFLATNKGEFRAYMITGEIIGWFFYYVSFGLAAKRFTDEFVRIFHKLCTFIFKVIFAPFRLIFKSFLKMKEIFLLFSQKLTKKFTKIRKKHLQNQRLYVYNLLGIFKKQHFVQKKGGSSNGKQKENAKKS